MGRGLKLKIAKERCLHGARLSRTHLRLLLLKVNGHDAAEGLVAHRIDRIDPPTPHLGKAAVLPSRLVVLPY
nr:MAG TPA: hypothetical protein [Caudoviricetes sp.]